MTVSGARGDREGYTERDDGTTLFWRFWRGGGDSGGSLMIVHGLGEHSGRYEAFARFLGGEGFSVFAFDLRGHGRSRGPRGDVEAFHRFVEDVAAMEDVMARVVEREVGLAVGPFVLGHSLGGLVVGRRLLEEDAPYAGAILSAPWLATPRPSWLLALGRLLGAVVPGLTVPARIGVKRLTRDPEVQREIREDPLVHSRLTARLYREADRAQEEVRARSGELTLPLLVLAPAEDRVVDEDVTLAFARGIPGGKVRVEELPGRRHEPLNDVGRDEVHGLVGGWLRDHAHAG